MRCAAAALWRTTLLGAWLLAAAAAVQACTVFEFNGSGFAGMPRLPQLLPKGLHAWQWRTRATEGDAVRAANVRHLYHTYSVFSQNGTVFVDNHKFPIIEVVGRLRLGSDELESMAVGKVRAGCACCAPCGHGVHGQVARWPARPGGVLPAPGARRSEPTVLVKL
jgi:hypothetical protein